MRPLLAIVLVGSGAALRVVPPPVGLRHAARSVSSVVMAPTWDNASEEPITDDMRRRLMEQQMTGYQPGGWDNDEYLAATKANPPPPPSNEAMIKQARVQILCHQAFLPTGTTFLTPTPHSHRRRRTWRCSRTRGCAQDQMLRGGAMIAGPGRLRCPSGSVVAG